jgi:FkbM family methyltransferase
LGWIVRRSIQIATDRQVRNAYLARSHIRRLQRIQPGLRVAGVDDDGGTTFVAMADGVITPLLLARGHFQRDDFLHAWELAQRLAPRPGATAFIDVGANVGTTTLYAARTGAFSRIVSVEPSPDNLAVLRLNVHANDLDEVVTVVPSACGAESGEVELLLSALSSGDHRVSRGARTTASHPRAVRVPEQTLDEILREAGVGGDDVALVWVDTQGHEPSVLGGAADTIGAGAPFLMEFWPEMYEQAGTLDAHVRTLGKLFRGFVDLRDPALAERPTDQLGALAASVLEQYRGQTDLLLLPRS